MPKYTTKFITRTLIHERHDSWEETPSGIISIQQIHNKLLAAINEKKFADLLVLQNNFVFPEILDESRTDEDTYGSGGFVHTTTVITTKHQSCPLIQAYLFDYPNLFAEIINALLQKNDPELFAAFHQYFTDNEETIKVFNWSTSIKAQLKSHIHWFEKYGVELHNKGIEKGKYIKKIVTDVKNKIDSQPVPPKTNKSLKTKFEILTFKLDLIKTLHSKDEELEQHRGYKDFIFTIIGILLVLPAVMNYLINNKVTFFEKTNSHEMRDNVKSIVLKA